MNNHAPKTRRRYLVFVTSWNAYAKWFEASSEDEAVEMAEKDYEDNFDAQWKHKDGGTGGFDVLATEEIGGAQ